ncbi:MAG: FAD:protein FMN transferase [Pedobacter sp.]
MIQYKLFLIWIPLLLLFLLKKDDRRQYFIHGYAQGTDYSIKYFAKDSVVTQKAVDSILLQIDSSMSLYKTYSLINKFNASSFGVKLDPHFLKVIQKSIKISKATNGVFDITVKPLVQAWGFGSKPILVFPDSAVIKQILPCVGVENLTLSGSYLRKKIPCVQIDLNGIAQGYSVDVVAELLTKKGIKSFVVEIGGELRIKGLKPDGTYFRIGIEGPANTDKAEPVMKHVIQLQEGAITTSGNYRKFLQQGSKKFSHLIDAKSGYPLQNSMISVTLYAKDAITADGYDNAIMALEPLDALNFVKSHKDLECYLIYHKSDGSIADTLSAGFKKLITSN